jgi:hypothetical protein
MNLMLTPPVEVALQALGPPERRKVDAWLERLKNWDNDQEIRLRAGRTASADNVYVVGMRTGVKISFRVENDRLVILNVATDAAAADPGAGIAPAPVASPAFEAGRGAVPGWLPDDELTREWVRLVQEFRSECDASDRRRLQDAPATGEAPS